MIEGELNIYFTYYSITCLEVGHFFPEDLITRCKEDTKHSLSNTLTNLSDSKNEQEQITKKKIYQFPTEENLSKGINGIKDLFASTNLNQDMEKEETSQKRACKQRERNPRIDFYI